VEPESVATRTGRSLRVEVTELDETGGMLSAASSLPERFAARADEIADSVVEVAERFRRRLVNRQSCARARPANTEAAAGTGSDRAGTVADADGWDLDEVRITFGLAVEAGSGVIVASGKAGATFGVEVSWSPRTAPTPTG
jgi:hypothetical protein